MKAMETINFVGITYCRVLKRERCERWPKVTKTLVICTHKAWKVWKLVSSVSSWFIIYLFISSAVKNLLKLFSHIHRYLVSPVYNTLSTHYLSRSLGKLQDITPTKDFVSHIYV